ncbi:Spore maturation protein CgeB [Pseudobacteriovorax antillogorgiicola]|uniref:Spore maturation protein CgeB n=2 Tax=Pseudobacteriovorax antillogorgiicola TaxID=1513793 RepID=A0A1Y6C707_9BACT|nr:spore maturation protein CgeB [Pseudobacteriovorax antillogorgiicola]SMF39414.1 Spore maturation protein CgeB [Pseudobacteriovorax antillogorgiicola]
MTSITDQRRHPLKVKGSPLLNSRQQWICMQVTGNKVLDVGCGLGSVSKSLAMLGKEVVGIDTNAAAIEQANRTFVDAEGRSEKLKYIQKSFFDQSLGYKEYDCIVLDCIIQTFANPFVVIDRCLSLLNENGRLVLTVPFDTQKFFNKERQLFVCDSARLLNKEFRVTDHEISSDWIGFSSLRERSSSDRFDELYWNIFRKTEQLLLESVRRSHPLAEVRKNTGNLEVEAYQSKLIPKQSIVFNDGGEVIDSEVTSFKQGSDRKLIEELRCTINEAKERESELLEKIREIKLDNTELEKQNNLLKSRELVSNEFSEDAQKKLRKHILSLEKEVSKYQRSHSYRLGYSLITLYKNPKSFFRSLRNIFSSFKKVPYDPAVHELGDKLLLEAFLGKKQQEVSQNNGVGEAGKVNELKQDYIDWPEFIPVGKKQASGKIKAASIFDQFSEECFKYEIDIVPVTKRGWKQEIIEGKPDILFLESSWAGNNGEWTYAMVSYKKPHLGGALQNMINFCKGMNIPVVFWNKEDPTNFEHFVDLAKDCDYIFTTDENMIPKYRKQVGHKNVFCLPFAAQPQVHNPVQSKGLKKYDICFSGSWYENIPSRKSQINLLLSAAKNYNLHIYDRMLFAKDHRKGRVFPEKFQKYIAGSLPYKKMLTAHKQYRVFLNVNSVENSPTMCSRRIFELLASGTPVISTKGKAIKRLFGNYVTEVSSEKQARVAIDSIINGDKRELNKQRHRAMRMIFANHTYSNRLDMVMEKVGIPKKKESEKVSVVVSTNRESFLDRLVENLNRQTLKEFEVVIVLNGPSMNRKPFEKIRKGISVSIYESAAGTLGYSLNLGIENSSGEFLFKMDDDDFYGPHYLTDMLDAFKYSGADVLGKKAVMCYLESRDEVIVKYPTQQHYYTDFITGATLSFRRYVWNKVKFADRNRGEDSNFLEECKRNKFIIYSADMYNYVIMRRADQNSHTWVIKEEQFARNTEKLCKGLNFKEIFV